MVLIQGGDHRAFQCLYDRFAPRLNGFFWKMLWSDKEMAEDFVHDLFAKIIDRPDLYKEPNIVKPWLFQIAANMCKNAYRKRSFETEYRQYLEKEGIHISGVERKIDEQIQMDLLTRSLTRMDEDTRTIFLLRYQQDLTISEIALSYDLPEGTIKSKLFHIRKHLSEAIKDDIKTMKYGA
ncbi:MAG: sigma-70 family RNA polymerase sigma factor [Marinoscillum sp.]